ncbi:hypothetical protein [Desulfococcus multivorans]|uniref:Uncharacterized protein n=1 Tax=Desulfococcus multivorans DSM 2059 TaxID=1121405 RepID=S7UUJ9_DESML|nr:hypothetical protein [Desulfococcus multivorans]AOY58720.1 conserved uncharacterized protein [Desulfococcus multivorans]AQV01003.1 hypothetical protein B2D07_09655 [Desulfococcus multivorans]EPR37729.1 hypothetical protein dsmv_3018 [Desulfococcus multivorans DSM 2059]SJZ47057.1 hypothetical protein SAMN02745446_00642 [Desulfococcus multivorans DSM 2059]
MRNESWIKVYRKLLDKPIWKNSTPEHKTVLMTLLLMANHETGEWEWAGEEFDVMPGQFVTSLSAIQERAGRGISLHNVRSALRKFEKLGFAASESTRCGRRITILKWETYQGPSPAVRKASRKAGANLPQTCHKAGATNKNNQNEKKDQKGRILFGLRPDAFDPGDDVILTVPLRAGDGFAGITQAGVADLQARFPDADVAWELSRLRDWNIANPDRRKSRVGFGRHVNFWLTRSPKRGPVSRPGAGRKAGVVTLPDGKAVSRAGYQTALAGMRVAQKLFGGGGEQGAER